MKSVNSILMMLAFNLAVLIPPAWSQTPLYFGWSAGAPYRFDFTGNGRVELAIYDPDTGALSVRLVNGDELCFDLSIAREGFAEACADYGDGKDDPALYQDATGDLYVWLSANNDTLFGPAGPYSAS